MEHLLLTSKCSIFLNIFEKSYISKALVWSEGLKKKTNSSHINMDAAAAAADDDDDEDDDDNNNDDDDDDRIFQKSKYFRKSPQMTKEHAKLYHIRSVL